MKWVIKDWVGNVLTFKDRFERPEFAVAKLFLSFDEASDWLSDAFGHLSDSEYENEVGEFYICERKD